MKSWLVDLHFHKIGELSVWFEAGSEMSGTSCELCQETAKWIESLVLEEEDDVSCANKLIITLYLKGHKSKVSNMKGEKKERKDGFSWFPLRSFSY